MCILILTRKKGDKMGNTAKWNFISFDDGGLYYTDYKNKKPELIRDFLHESAESMIAIHYENETINQVKQYKELIIELNKCGNDIHSFLTNQLMLSSDFAKELNLLDAVASDCFVPATSIGQSLIYLLDNYSFVVRMKKWKRREIIIIFDIVENDFVIDHINNLSRFGRDID